MSDPIQIEKDDLKWLLENTIREVCIQIEEYSCRPEPEDVQRILRLMGNLEINMGEMEVGWLLDAGKPDGE
jgi:hypothetical protein